MNNDDVSAKFEVFEIITLIFIKNNLNNNLNIIITQVWYHLEPLQNRLEVNHFVYSNSGKNELYDFVYSYPEKKYSS